jgi:hypothetical protein
MGLNDKIYEIVATLPMMAIRTGVGRFRRAGLRNQGQMLKRNEIVKM